MARNSAVGSAVSKSWPEAARRVKSKDAARRSLSANGQWPLGPKWKWEWEWELPAPGLGLRLHTHTVWTRNDQSGRTEDNNGRLPTRLPQFNAHRIGLRRAQLLGNSTGSEMLYSNTAMLCHVTCERHLQPQSAQTIVLRVLQRRPGNSRLHCRHSTGHSNPPVKVEHSINERRMS